MAFHFGISTIRIPVIWKSPIIFALQGVRIVVVVGYWVPNSCPLCALLLCIFIWGFSLWHEYGTHPNRRARVCCSVYMPTSSYFLLLIIGFRNNLQTNESIYLCFSFCMFFVRETILIPRTGSRTSVLYKLYPVLLLEALLWHQAPPLTILCGCIII